MLISVTVARGAGLEPIKRFEKRDYHKNTLFAGSYKDAQGLETMNSRGYSANYSGHQKF